MDPVTKALLTSWDWRPEVILILFTVGGLYTIGWWRLRQRARGRTSNWWAGALWRPISYVAGLLFIGLALLSPLDVMGSVLFSMHMIQHLLLIMIAPPLLLLANPMPYILWGLPTAVRRKVGRAISRLLHRQSTFRRGLQRATTPGIVWLIWFISILMWHDPNLYNAALRYEWVHDLEHLTFFMGGMLFWWHVTGAGPRIHKQFGLFGRIAFTLSAIPPNMLTGIVIAFASQVIYTYYLDVPRVLGLSALDDQRLGGLIMWVPGSMMYLIAGLILIARMLQQEDDKPPLPESEWGTEQSLRAPGMK